MYPHLPMAIHTLQRMWGTFCKAHTFKIIFVHLVQHMPIVSVTTACRLQAVQLIKEQQVFEMEDDIAKNALKLLKMYEGMVYNA
jgi:hypothetical protein